MNVMVILNLKRPGDGHAHGIIFCNQRSLFLLGYTKSVEDQRFLVVNYQSFLVIDGYLLNFLV